jgi:hypothetical protein
MVCITDDPATLDRMGSLHGRPGPLLTGRGSRDSSILESSDSVTACEGNVMNIRGELLLTFSINSVPSSETSRFFVPLAFLNL